VYQINQAQYYTDQEQGDYALSFQFVGGGNMVWPRAAYLVLYYDFEGYNAVGTKVTRLKMGNAKGSSTEAPRERDIPTSFKVPGLGSVRPAVLAYEMQFQLTRKSQERSAIQLAKITNYWMPAIPLFNQYEAIIYSTDRWADWPSTTSYLQNMNNVSEAWMYWAQYGWLKPKV
jgi:hypothetical protein